MTIEGIDPREIRGPLPTACDDAYCTSGPSPTLHVLGAGQVGRALLELSTGESLTAVAVSDRSGTVFDGRGVDTACVREAKRCALGVSSLTRGRRVDLDLAIALVAADCVADCTTTNIESEGASVTRSLAVLDRGGCLAFAAKDALLHAPDRLLREDRLERVGFNAVLGGTGLALKRELGEIRKDVRSVRCVPNATTTSIIEELECGVDFETALSRTVERGLCEADASLDLGGVDAAIKLAFVASVVSGVRRSLDEVRLPCDLRELDYDVLTWRASRGLTTRLVGELQPGGDLVLAYREVPRASTSAVSSDHVVYAYELDRRHRRVHHGSGLGPVGTARAVLADVAELTRERVRQVAAGRLAEVAR